MRFLAEVGMRKFVLVRVGSGRHGWRKGGLGWGGNEMKRVRGFVCFPVRPRSISAARAATRPNDVDRTWLFAVRDAV